MTGICSESWPLCNALRYHQGTIMPWNYHICNDGGSEPRGERFTTRVAVKWKDTGPLIYKKAFKHNVIEAKIQVCVCVCVLAACSILISLSLLGRLSPFPDHYSLYAAEPQSSLLTFFRRHFNYIYQFQLHTRNRTLNKLHNVQSARMKLIKVWITDRVLETRDVSPSKQVLGVKMRLFLVWVLCWTLHNI